MNPSVIRGKKMVALAKLLGNAPTFCEENTFVSEGNKTQQGGQFIYISESCVIRDDQVQPTVVVTEDPEVEIFDLFEKSKKTGPETHVEPEVQVCDLFEASHKTGTENHDNDNRIIVNETESQKLSIFCEDNTFVGEINTQDGQFIKVSDICGINGVQPMVVSNDPELQIDPLKESEKTGTEHFNNDIGVLNDCGSQDSNDLDAGKKQEHEIIKEDILEDMPENLIQENLDPNETLGTLTKKGTERKRKKYKLNRKARTEIRNFHRVVVSCHQNCKFKCTNAFSEEQRERINKEFWQLNLKEQKSFVMNSTECKIPSRKTEGSKKNKTYTYFLKDISGIKMRVCKVFFLTTLGYKKQMIG
ncbi:unnamed protein product [Psylliodes chrysocephalus]|uniref:Uncharacterized protein n=1 Tax=Psylliodes chrysocephalus TaxID=3402493 RepID=A0A9P0CN45_9CUCU|nr:unnamed protein product [Psylliodes chrysocephala]